MLAAGLAVLPNHQDDVRHRRAAEQELAKQEAEALRKAAQALPTAADGKKSEAAKALEALARELERSPNLETAKKAVDTAAAKLASGLDPNFLSQKAALKGLERALGTRPLPGANGSAAEQLRQTASQLAGLTPEQRQALADRLASLAATQTAGNPDAAQALSQAAVGLAFRRHRRGRHGSGQRRLRPGRRRRGRRRPGSHRPGARRPGGRPSRPCRGAAVEPGQPGSPRSGSGSRARAKDRAKDKDRARARAKGRDKARVKVRDRVWPGPGPGPRHRLAERPGGRLRRRAPARAVGAASALPTAPAATPPSASQSATVYDPIAGGDGEQINLGGRPGQGPTTAAGRGQGLHRASGARVPLERALPYYRAEATRALDSLNLPPSLRALVRAYFDSLGAE